MPFCRKLLIRNREPPLGGVAIQRGVPGAVALDCFAAALLATTSEVLQETATRWATRNSLCKTPLYPVRTPSTSGRRIEMGPPHFETQSNRAPRPARQ
jgi:hypothetical protein